MRTGPLLAGPRVVKLRPERDLRGVPITPAVATLVPDSAPTSTKQHCPWIRSWIERRNLGDVVDIVDTRGSRRELRVVEATPRRLASRSGTQPTWKPERRWLAPVT